MIAMIAIVVLKCFFYSDYKPPSEINPFVYKASLKHRKIPYKEV